MREPAATFNLSNKKALESSGALIVLLVATGGLEPPTSAL